MKFSEIKAIDAHGHYGRFPHADDLLEKFSSASGAEVAQRASDCGVEWSIVSPLEGLMPRGRETQVAPANEVAFQEVPTGDV